jgi:N-acetylmuramoyl-L-alanine amidase
VRLQAAAPAWQQSVTGANVFALSTFGLFSFGSVNLASLIPITSSVSTTTPSPAPAVTQPAATANVQGGQPSTPPPARPPQQPAPPAQTNALRLTAAELDLFARLVHAEAAGEPFEGQVAVAASVLNRVRSPLFPNTLTAVIHQVVNGHYQYSPVLDGRINLPANESARRAVQEALNGRDPSLGATGFFNPRKTNNQWVRSRPVTVTIGQHVFFR